MKKLQQVITINTLFDLASSLSEKSLLDDDELSLFFLLGNPVSALAFFCGNKAQ